VSITLIGIAGEFGARSHRPFKLGDLGIIQPFADVASHRQFPRRRDGWTNRLDFSQIDADDLDHEPLVVSQRPADMLDRLSISWMDVPDDPILSYLNSRIKLG
jgi:hypothetical protein